jgi:hypothetical protein
MGADFLFFIKGWAEMPEYRNSNIIAIAFFIGGYLQSNIIKIARAFAANSIILTFTIHKKRE